MCPGVEELKISCSYNVDIEDADFSLSCFKNLRLEKVAMTQRAIDILEAKLPVQLELEDCKGVLVTTMKAAQFGG